MVLPGAGGHQRRRRTPWALTRSSSGPQPVGDLKWVKASYDSVRGKVVSEWRREAGKFNLRVRVPVGVTATVILPSKEGTPVTEGGKPVEHDSGVVRLNRAGATATVTVESGEYEFRSQP